MFPYSLADLVSGSHPPKHGWVWVPSHGISLKSPGIIWLFPRALCHSCNIVSCRQFTLIAWEICGWLGVYLSPLVGFWVSSRTMNASMDFHRDEGSTWAPAQHHCVGWVLEVLSSAGVLVCGEHQKPREQPGLFEGSPGILLANNSIGCNLF